MDYNATMYRLAIIALLIVFAGLQYRLWVGEGSLAQVHRLQTMHADLEQANAKAKSRNQTMLAQISDLKSGKLAAEGRARSQLGMIKSDETFFLTPQDEGPHKTVRSAQKKTHSK